MTERPAVEYYFSFISLWSYVGSLVFQDIAKHHDVRVEFKPIDLMAVFAAAAASRYASGRRSVRPIGWSRWSVGNGSAAFRW